MLVGTIITVEHADRKSIRADSSHILCSNQIMYVNPLFILYCIWPIFFSERIKNKGVLQHVRLQLFLAALFGLDDWEKDNADNLVGIKPENLINF